MMVWKYLGAARPPFAQAPGPDQESVWDYPRPPAIEADPRRVLVRSGGVLLADTPRALRVLETASPPTFYLPPEDVRREWLIQSSQRSWCEWKGEAVYFDVKTPGSDIVSAGWSYLDPRGNFAALAGFFSFYPGKLECYVDDERVRPQPGGFYGGWLTSEIVGPVKGEPGTGGW